MDLLKGLKTFEIPHLPEEQLQLRIGLHTGSLVKDASLNNAELQAQSIVESSVNIAVSRLLAIKFDMCL